MAFNMFPTPKYLRIENSIKQIEMIIPLLELPRTNEKKKTKRANKFTKNRKTKNDELGSVKKTIDIKLRTNRKVTMTEGRKFFLLRTICFRISLCMTYNYL